MSDQALAEAIDRVLPLWLKLKVVSEQEIAVGVLLGPAAQARVALAEGLSAEFHRWLAAPLDASLGIYRGTMASAIQPERLCDEALQVAAERDAASAVGWLHKILGIRSAPGRALVSVTGLSVDRADALLLGIQIHPPSPRPGDPTGLELGRRAFLPQAGAELSFAIPDMPFIAPMAAQDAFDAVLAAHARLEEVATALAMLGGAPRVDEYWIEFDDPDLERVGERGARMFSLREHNRFGAPPVDVPTAIELLRGYERLRGKMRQAMDLALDRLVSARINQHVGDKALDGAIALEALLVPDGNAELNYRLSLRAARFLGSSLAERLEIKRSVKSFYSIRSAVAHGSKSAQAAGGGDARAVVEQGLMLVQLAIQKICLSSPGTDWETFWEALELGD